MRYSREISIAVALGILLLTLAIGAPTFYDWAPFITRITALMPALVAACGICLVLICKEIDISVGAIFSCCAISGGGLMHHLPWPVAMLCAIAAGAAMGAINGLLVGKLKLPSIVVTLASLAIWSEALRLTQQGRLLSLPKGIQWFGLSQSAGQYLIIILTLTVFSSLTWLLKNLRLGRYFYAVGSDAEAARLAGINAPHITLLAFSLMGALTGLAAMLNLVQSPQVQPTCGEGLEMKVIAAAVVGGIAIQGGRGSLWGMLPSLFLLGFVNPALVFFHIPPYWEKAIQGTVILLAVASDAWRRRPKLTTLCPK
jgi:rhamnose transport system permease protein